MGIDCSFRPIATGLWVAMLCACGGHSSAKHSTLDGANREAKLRGELRRSRARVLDLEKQLASAKIAKMESFEIGGEDVAGTDLPVQVREPAVLASIDQAPRDYEVMGTDDEGVEIVYVGEATSDETYKIPLGRYDLAARPSRRGRDQEAASDLPVPNGVLANRGAAGPTIANQLRQARSVGPRAGVRDDDGPRDEYQRYYRALRTGNHSFAVTGFRNFVERYPSHEYADNAQYWLGEAFYDQKKYAEALQEFERVVANHPKGNKVPDALLKIGYTQVALKEGNSARAMFGDLIQKYPDSNAARLARAKLVALGREKKKD